MLNRINRTNNYGTMKQIEITKLADSELCSIFILFRKMLVSRPAVSIGLRNSTSTMVNAIVFLLSVSLCCYSSNGMVRAQNVNEINLKSTTPMASNHDQNNNHNNVAPDSGDKLNYYYKHNSSDFKAHNATRTSHLTGNELWDGIIKDCYQKPSVSCFQKNVFAYLDDALSHQDVNITNHLKFYKNQVDYLKYTREANADGHLEDNVIPHESRADTPIEEVTNALYGKSVKFVMTHDVELKLPEVVFDGATFRISPRAIEGNGVIAKLELIPKTEVEARDSGRIFKKKIQQFFKNKLLLGFLALLLIIKIVKIKLFWLLPIIVGVGTAKKLLLKFLLFLFPALSHLFKLCSYYQQTYHTKYHTHHHHINHHHTIAPPWHGEPHGPGGHHGPPEIIYTNPPKSGPTEYIYGPPSNDHYNPSWESSGPGLGSEYVGGDIHRDAQVDGNYFKPKVEDANELHSWGLGTTNRPSQLHPATSHSIHVNPFLGQQSLNAKNQGPVFVPQRSSASNIAAQYDPAISQQSVEAIQLTQAQVKEALRIQAEQKLISNQQKILSQQPFVQDGKPLMPKNYDPFYSPILEKVDKIFQQLGFTDNNCKERLVCNMYKTPSRYSPHSNFISAELSRDANELQTPESTNESVIRFYRLVQAARDGQDQRDCLQLYPHCSIATK